jgi:hypothetical protein
MLLSSLPLRLWRRAGFFSTVTLESGEGNCILRIASYKKLTFRGVLKESSYCISERKRRAANGRLESRFRSELRKGEVKGDDGGGGGGDMIPSEPNILK